MKMITSVLALIMLSSMTPGALAQPSTDMDCQNPPDNGACAGRGRQKKSTPKQPNKKPSGKKPKRPKRAEPHSGDGLPVTPGDKF